MLRVILGLGGNLGDVRDSFVNALGTLEAVGRVGAVSRVWRTRAVGPPQPDYLNAAVLLEWRSDLRQLFARCLELERAAGRDRQREERWGPRTLDLDLLLAENFVSVGPTLTLPHPRFHTRRFALEPAAEVAPEWTHPLLGRTIAELAEEARQREPDAILEVIDFEFSILNS
jgi:2-amino-4-hydroxy-6-hydroxymethyldihydropteridine diphosphokinase